MFFKNKATILYLSKKIIWIKSPDFKKTIKLKWDGQNLLDVFKQVKNKLAFDRCRIILGHDLSFSLSLMLESNQLNREEILNQAQALIPVEISDQSFDWQLVPANEKKKSVEVFAIAADFYQQLLDAVKKNQINVELIQAAPALLCRAYHDFSLAYLLIHLGYENIAMVVRDERILFTQDLAEFKNNVVEDLLVYIKEKFNLDIDHLIISKLFNNADKFKLKVPPTMIKLQKNIDPMQIIAGLKTPRSKKDEDVLEIKILKETDHQQILMMMGVGIILGIVMSLVIIFFLNFDSTQWFNNSFLLVNKNTSNQQAEQAVLDKRALITPRPTTVGLDKYQLQIQNGSKYPNLDQQIKDILAIRGFKNIDLGPNFEQGSDIKISRKTSVPDSVFNELKDILTSETNGVVIIEFGELTEAEKYDLIIRVGNFDN